MATAIQEYAIDDGRIRISFEERAEVEGERRDVRQLSLIHISEPTRRS